MRATWEDEDGRRHAVTVPDGQDYLARQGIPVGPPDLSSLGLPVEIEVRLHNALHDRGLLTEKDVRRRPADVQAALQYALKVGTHSIINLYMEDGDGHHVSTDY